MRVPSEAVASQMAQDLQDLVADCGGLDLSPIGEPGTTAYAVDVSDADRSTFDVVLSNGQRFRVHVAEVLR